MDGRKGFFLSDQYRKNTEKNNEDFRVRKPAETELIDLLDFASLPDKVGSDWGWYTATEIARKLKLDKKYTAQAIGEALTQIKKHYESVQKKRTHGRVLYYVPKLPAMLY